MVTDCLRILLETFRKTPYDSGSQRHEELLMEIWERLRPGVALTGRKTNQWIEVGFQADDPATDFRGSGVLGLINLHRWVGTQEGKQAFQTADTPSTEYFFASASIFMTMLACELCRDFTVHPKYWMGAEEWKFPDWEAPFQRVFSTVWGDFVLFWEGREDKSMMQFNQTLLAFSRTIRQPAAAARLNRALGVI